MQNGESIVWTIQGVLRLEGTLYLENEVSQFLRKLDRALIRTWRKKYQKQ